MFIDYIISKTEVVCNYFSRINVQFYLTKPQTRYLLAFMISMLIKGFNGKITDVSDFMFERHRTSIGRFLSESTWNENFIKESLNKQIIEKILKISKDTGEPIYAIIDDTISERTKPSSKALAPIDMSYFHFSHLERKTVYGHQILGVMLQCGKILLPLSMEVYEKKKSKIEMAIDVIKTLPIPPGKGFVLCDSWFSGKKLIAAAKEAGYTYIGALRSNRVIYPNGSKGLSVKISHISERLGIDDVRLVKVGKSEYYVYEYRGKFNGVKNALIIISWQKEHLFKDNYAKGFICTDDTFTGFEALGHYIKRWPIEIFFREGKKYLGLDDYQVRSSKSIKRYLILLRLTYTFCELEVSENNVGFSLKSIKNIRKQIEKTKISWIYDKFSNSVSKNEIFSILKIS